MRLEEKPKDKQQQKQNASQQQQTMKKQQMAWSYVLIVKNLLQPTGCGYMHEAVQYYLQNAEFLQKKHVNADRHDYELNEHHLLNNLAKLHQPLLQWQMPYRSQYNQNHSSPVDAFDKNKPPQLHTGNHQHQWLTLHQLFQQPNAKPFAAQQQHRHNTT